ncbi:MAG: PadR family transcriptional regulator [Ardenticatenaceae bacterium]|nr:PadR family transcriptional regulator [Ardenticatenaceae bacterium]
MANNNSHYEGLAQELRRGALVLAVLSQLDRPEYGYSLKQALSEKGLDINEGTLYPLLRRLEKQGLLTSDWQVIDDARPRRYYEISKEGRETLRQLAVEWYGIVGVMDGLLEDVNKGKLST